MFEISSSNERRNFESFAICVERLAVCYENPLRGNGRENGFWNKRKGSVIFLFSFNAWKIAHCAFNSWIRKFDPIFGRLLSSPSAVRIYPTRLRDWKLFSLAGETRKTRGKMEGGSWDEWSIAVERPTSCKSVTSDFIRLPPPLPPGFAPRGEKKSLAYGTWKDSYSLVYVLREGKKKENRKKEKYLESWALDSIRSLVYITTTRGKVKKGKKKKEEEMVEKCKATNGINRRWSDAFRSCCNSSMTRDPRHSMA